MPRTCPGTFTPASAARPTEVSSLACPSLVEGTTSSASRAGQFGCFAEHDQPRLVQTQDHLSSGAVIDEVMCIGGFAPLALEPTDLLIGSLSWKDSWCPVAPFPLWRRPLSFRGDCERSAQWPLRFCCLCFLQLFPALPGLSGYSNSCCGAESAPWGQCPGSPGRWGRSHSYFAAWDLRVCIVAALQHRVICICVVFFCPKSHSKLCSELLPLARSTAQAGSFLQLTWCLPQIQQFKLKLA